MTLVPSLRTRGRLAPVLIAVAVAAGGGLAIPSVAAAKAVPCTVTIGSRSYTELGTALSDARDGDTLTLRGVCPGPVAIGYDITLRGAPMTYYGNPLDPKIAVGGPALAVLSIGAGVTATVQGLTIARYTTSGANGGGISVGPGAHLTLRSVRVLGDASDAAGGGIWAGIGAHLTITGRSLIADNTADRGGGLAAESGSVIEIRGRTRFGNNVATEGGAILADGASIHVGGRAIIEGSGASTGNGGAILATGGSILVDGRAIIRDGSATNGGGIAATGTAVTVRGHARLGGSHARNAGGVLFLTGGASLLIEGDARIDHGSSDAAGGGLLLSGLASALISGNARIAANTAGTVGGGIDTAGTSLAIAGSARIVGNSATQEGGGFFVASGAVVGQSSLVRVRLNHAGGTGGGGVYVGNGASLLGLQCGTELVDNTPDQVRSFTGAGDC